MVCLAGKQKKAGDACIQGTLVVSRLQRRVGTQSLTLLSRYRAKRCCLWNCALFVLSKTKCLYFWPIADSSLRSMADGVLSAICHLLFAICHVNVVVVMSPLRLPAGFAEWERPATHYPQPGVIETGIPSALACLTIMDRTGLTTDLRRRSDEGLFVKVR